MSRNVAYDAVWFIYWLFLCFQDLFISIFCHIASKFNGRLQKDF